MGKRGMPPKWLDPAKEALEAAGKALSWKDMFAKIGTKVDSKATSPELSMRGSLTQAEEFAIVDLESKTGVGLLPWYTSAEYFQEVLSAFAEDRWPSRGLAKASELDRIVGQLSDSERQHVQTLAGQLEEMARVAGDRRVDTELLAKWTSRLNALLSGDKSIAAEVEMSSDRVADLESRVQRILTTFGLDEVQEGEGEDGLQVAFDNIKDRVRTELLAELRHELELSVNDLYTQKYAEVFSRVSDTEATARRSHDMAQNAAGRIDEFERRTNLRWERVMAAGGVIVGITGVVIALISALR